MSKRRALLLVNRHSRRGKEALESAIAHLQAHGFELTIESDTKPKKLAELIRRHRKLIDLVIVGGGDGTLNAAADGLIETQLPLGILPLGTANDLARTLKLPLTLPEACRVIADNHLQAIDLGCVNGKHFFNVASLGLSVKITQQLSKEAKRRWGVLAYAVTALQVLTKSRPLRAEILVNGESHFVKTLQIAVGNGRHYGGGLTVAEDAAITDQRLDLYSLEIQHWWQIIRLLPALRQGTHGHSDYVRTIAAKEIEIHTAKRYPINTDGEITTCTPATFSVVPNAISVFVPAHSNEL